MGRHAACAASREGPWTERSNDRQFSMPCILISRAGEQDWQCRVAVQGKGSLTSDLAFMTWCALRSPAGLCRAGGWLLCCRRTISAISEAQSAFAVLCAPHTSSTGHAGQVDGFIAAHASKRSLQELDDPRLDQQVSCWTALLQSAKAAG